MGVNAEDLRKLAAQLEARGPQISGPGTMRALRAGAKVYLKAIKESAPVLDMKTPGSDALEPGSLRDGNRIYAPPDQNPPQLLIGPNAKVSHVARFVEFGHRMIVGGYNKIVAGGKSRGSGVNTGKDVPPHPYLRPAAEASEAAANDAMQASYAETLKDVMSR